MHKLTIALAVTLACLSSYASAECTAPTKPEIADGSSASVEALMASQQAIKAYMADANAFLECLDKASAEAAANGETDEQIATRTARYNAMVDEMEQVSASWSQEITEYKARSAE